VDTRGNQRIRRMPVAEQTKITALDNGPYLVKGPVVVVDAEGNRFPAERETIALCRCGGLDDKAVLRRHPLEGRLSGGGEGRQRGGRAGTLENQGAFRQL
jgi:Iron-binding zinc finger CDGSH type